MLRKHLFLHVSLLAALALFMPSCVHRLSPFPDQNRPFSDVDMRQIDDLLLQMSPEEKIGQLLVGRSSIHYEWDANLLRDWLKDGQAGGFLLENLSLRAYLDFREKANAGATIPPFFMTKQKIALHNQFEGLPRFPAPATIQAIDSAQLEQTLIEHYAGQSKALGIQLCAAFSLAQNTPKTPFNPDALEGDSVAWMAHAVQWTRALYQNRLLPVADGFSDFMEKDTSARGRAQLAHLRQKYQALAAAGLGGIQLSPDFLEKDSLENHPPGFLSDYLNNDLNFKGLIISESNNITDLEKAFHAGTDLFLTEDIHKTYQFLHQMYVRGHLSPTRLNESVRKVLIAKSWINGGKLPTGNSPKMLAQNDQTSVPKAQFASAPKRTKPTARQQRILDYFTDEVWPDFIRLLYEHSIVLVNNPESRLPYGELYTKDFRLIQFADEHLTGLENQFSKYAPYARYLYRPDEKGQFSHFDLNEFRWAFPVIVLDNVDLENTDNQELIESINKLALKTKVVLINFGNPWNLSRFVPELAMIQVFERHPFTERAVAAALFGGIRIGGHLPVHISDALPYGAGIEQPAIRIRYGVPEDEGISSNKLAAIDSIAQWAIDQQMTPGCQVLVARNGDVIYSKAFGRQSYNAPAPVRISDLYDLASVTKIAATTLAVMALSDQNLLDIDAKVSRYLTLPDSSTIGDLTLRELLTHHSGLQPNMPIARYLRRSNQLDSTDCNALFCRERRDSFQIQITENLYFNQFHLDSIWNEVCRLDISRRGRYRYSDVNFIILQKIVEQVSQQPLNAFVFQRFYKPLGMRNTGFRPKSAFPDYQIVPTAEDTFWRKELLRGFVHDETAALFGGVAGNAGLFSNAEDLVVLMEMLLEGGVYENRQFIRTETVGQFIKASKNQQRGLGFDKPGLRGAHGCSNLASPATFGHSGFTGTCVWVDPNEGLIYIFLSNRINPNISNRKLIREHVREKIHEVVYQSLNTFDASLPRLPDAAH
ncbi:MAG: hypothetical protein D6714_17940 [Bacteroidetes bacterium]|nr:MAG: hypothetical protein D6714_17940 [Bacteroidota bacterium]